MQKINDIVVSMKRGFSQRESRTKGDKVAYQSKRAIASIVAGIAIAIAYFFYATGSASPAVNDIQGWALSILITIGIGIVVIIIIQILFHIFFSVGVAIVEHGSSDQHVERIIEASMQEDEMGKIIELKSGKAAAVFAGVGFLAMLIALALGNPFIWALHIMFAAMMLGSIASGIAEIYFYEKGVS